MSGISQPIRYCTTSSATTSQWNTFAVVPYCKRSVMISLWARIIRQPDNDQADACFIPGPDRNFYYNPVRGKRTQRVRLVTSGLKGSRGGVRHRVDRPGKGGAIAAGRTAAGDRKCISHNGLDDPAIGRRRQSVTNTEVHVKDAELEIGHGEQKNRREGN